MYPTLRPALQLPLTALAILGCRDFSDPTPANPAVPDAVSARDDAIPPRSCMIITRPGTYRVVEDLRPCRGWEPVAIQADDVTVLLSGSGGPICWSAA